MAYIIKLFTLVITLPLTWLAALATNTIIILDLDTLGLNKEILMALKLAFGTFVSQKEDKNTKIVVFIPKIQSQATFSFNDDEPLEEVDKQVNYYITEEICNYSKLRNEEMDNLSDEGFIKYTVLPEYRNVKLWGIAKLETSHVSCATNCTVDQEKPYEDQSILPAARPLIYPLDKRKDIYAFSNVIQVNMHALIPYISGLKRLLA